MSLLRFPVLSKSVMTKNDGKASANSVTIANVIVEKAALRSGA